MDPISVLKTLWRHKIVIFPVIVLTLAAAAYVFLLAPRSYEASVTYAIVNPKIPSEAEMEQDPRLAALNSDNPYLRSSDNTLIAQVLIAKIGSEETAKQLEAQGLGTEFTVARASSMGTGLLVAIHGYGDSPDQAVNTVQAIGGIATKELDAMQRINGADDTYLFSALQVDGPGTAKEQFSSRLRSVIMVAAGGVVLLFGAVSFARAVETGRERRAETQAEPRARRASSEHRAGSQPFTGESAAPGVRPEGRRNPTRETKNRGRRQANGQHTEV